MSRVVIALVWVATTACGQRAPGTMPGGTDANLADTTTSDATSSDTTPNDAPASHDPTKNCVGPGTMNNDAAVGGYCNPEAGIACPKPAGEFRICSGSVPDVPLHAWFCTKPCERDEECGGGALCLTNELGRGCVPFPCAPDAAVVDALSRSDVPSD